jgi:hypothetical protein
MDDSYCTAADRIGTILVGELNEWMVYSLVALFWFNFFSSSARFGFRDGTSQYVLNIMCHNHTTVEGSLILIDHSGVKIKEGSLVIPVLGSSRGEV